MTISRYSLSLIWLVLWLCAGSVLAQSGRRAANPSAAPARQPSENVLRIPTTEVQLVVTVRDSLERPVVDLEPTDFLIYDDGKRYEPAHCEYRQLPAHVLLLLDASSAWEGGPEFLSQAIERFQRALAPQDWLAVLQFTDELVLTQDWAKPSNALQHALRPALRPNGKAALTDALMLASAKLAETEGQRIIVLLTRGLNTNGLSNFAHAQRTLQRVAATVYVLSQTEALAATLRRPHSPGLQDVPSLEKSLLQFWLTQAEAELNALAANSGGKIYFPVQARSLLWMLPEIAADLHGQYWLSYVLEEEEGSLERLHQIQVLTPKGHQTYTRIRTASSAIVNSKLSPARN